MTRGAPIPLQQDVVSSWAKGPPQNAFIYTSLAPPATQRPPTRHPSDSLAPEAPQWPRFPDQLSNMAPQLVQTLSLLDFSISLSPVGTGQTLSIASAPER